jgi:hypothetical protein
VKTPWFAVCLHWIKKADPEPYLHDHPVTLVSYVLRGWYVERRLADKYNTGFHENPDRLVDKKNRINGAAWDRHSIIEVAPEGCLTLCFMGPKVREWGFHTPDGWVMWKDYYATKRANNETA